MQTAKNAAYELLDVSGINRYPITVDDLNKIADKKGWLLRSYEEGAEILQYAHLQPMAKSVDAFVATISGKKVILYNGEMGVDRKIYTIAHEMGHIALKHKDRTGISQLSGEENEHENDADTFALCLLAPPCVVQALSPDRDYMRRIKVVSTLNGAQAEKALALIDVDNDRSAEERKLLKNLKKYIKNMRRINSPLIRAAIMTAKILLIIAIGTIVIHRVGVELGFFSRVVSSWNGTPAEAITRNAGKYN